MRQARLRLAESVNLNQSVNWSHPLNRGLIRWYLALPMRASGFTWRDLCNRRHGTLTNGATWGRPFKRPGGLSSMIFDGTDDYIDCGSPTIGAACTVAFWGWPTSVTFTGYSCVDSLENTTSGDGYRMMLDSASPAKISWRKHVAFASTTVTATGTLTAGTWFHAIGTCDASGAMALYFNGVADGTGTRAGTPSATPLHLGQRPNGSIRLNGRLDDVRIYNRGLSAAEARLLYLESRQGNPGLLNRVSPAWMGNAAAAASGMGSLVAGGLVDSGLVAGGLVA